MADKYHSDTQEKIETIYYAPLLKDSGDLEAATKTITVTAQQGTPDYSTSLTTDAPGDNRLVVMRLCVRLQLTIDSMTAGHLYGALHVNGVERMTFDFTSTGDKLTAVDLTTGQFNLGAANALAVFLWVDSGNAVVSVCQLWQGVGSKNSGNSAFASLSLTFEGLAHITYYVEKIGTGTPEMRAEEPTLPFNTGKYWPPESGGLVAAGHTVLVRNMRLFAGSSVITDIGYFYAINFILLRREQ